MAREYIVEREFEHAGYKCVVTFGDMGHRCGYVGIPESHLLYGKHYDKHLKIKKADIGDREVSGIFPLLGACLDDDERIRIEAYFQCHGGITYAGGGENSKYPIESDLWWFGFDCAHAKPDRPVPSRDTRRISHNPTHSKQSCFSSIYSFSVYRLLRISSGQQTDKLLFTVFKRTSSLL